MPGGEPPILKKRCLSAPAGYGKRSCSLPEPRPALQELLHFRAPFVEDTAMEVDSLASDMDTVTSSENNDLAVFFVPPQPATYCYVLESQWAYACLCAATFSSTKSRAV